MKHLYFYYLLGVMNIRYDKRKDLFTSSKLSTALKLVFHLIVPNVVLLTISIIGKTGILLTIPSVHMVVFAMRIVWTMLTMNITMLLNYLFTSKNQMALLNECLTCLRDAQTASVDESIAVNSSFRRSKIVLGIFLLHYTNYEINQYTYVLLYDEKWPELTFYILFYFLEMVTVVNALYYAAVLDIVHRTVQLDRDRLANCLQQNAKNDPFELDDPYWWRTIEHFYQRVLTINRRKRDYKRAFQLQLIMIALNTFIASFAIFYVNLNSMLLYAHNNVLEKYKRVTECLGFFPQLGALLLICYHAYKLENEQQSLMQLIMQTQSKLTKCTANLKRGDIFNSRIIILQSQLKISPYNMLNIDLEYFFGIVAAIVTYLVVLLQFRIFENSRE
uniref:Gustatory receptor n=1 Tax=Anopheles epiroticus TaxID=199890 RepID=A0A182PIL1_9DIPT